MVNCWWFGFLDPLLKGNVMKGVPLQNPKPPILHYIVDFWWAYIGSLHSLHNWVLHIIPKIQQITRGPNWSLLSCVFFFVCSLHDFDVSRLHQSSTYRAWTPSCIVFFVDVGNWLTCKRVNIWRKLSPVLERQLPKYVVLFEVRNEHHVAIMSMSTTLEKNTYCKIPQNISG